MDSMRRRPKWISIALGIILGIPCITGGVFVWSLKSNIAKVADTLPAELKAAKSAGIPTSADDLRQLTALSDMDNAAPVYRQAFAALNKAENGKGIEVRCRDYISGKLKPADLPQLEKAIEARRTAFALLKKASHMRGADWKRDWSHAWDLKFDEMQQAKTAVILLNTAALMDAKKNRMAEAFDLLESADRIAEHMGAEPTIIARLLSYSSDMRTAEAISVILREHSDAVTLNLADKLVRRRQPVSISSGLSGEAALMLISIDGMSEVSGYSSDESSDSKVNQILVRDPVYRKAWAAKFLHYMTPCYASLTTAKDWRTMDAALAKLDMSVVGDKSLENRMNQMFSPFFRGTGQSWAQATARRHMLAAGIALKREKARTGRLLASLPPSDPWFVDPYDDKTLRLLPDKGGFKVYSVSIDLTDDKGLTDAEDKGTKSKTHDLAYSFD